MQNNFPIVAGSFPMAADLFVTASGKEPATMGKLFTSLATFCTIMATLGGACTSSIFRLGRKLMQNMLCGGWRGTGRDACSLPMLFISQPLVSLVTGVLSWFVYSKSILHAYKSFLTRS